MREKRGQLKVRFRTWSQVTALCDTAECQAVHFHMPGQKAQVGESVTAKLVLPDGLSARVAAVVSDCKNGQATVALIGLTSALIARLRSLSTPAEEAALARGSGTMKVSELLRSNSRLRAQIDALAANMQPSKKKT